MKLLVVCIDALDPQLVETYGLFKSLQGHRGVVWTDTARQGLGASSALTWVCMYTGSKEEELNHLRFLQARVKNLKSHTVSDTAKKPIWAKISDMGYRVGVLEGLVTDVQSMPQKEGNFILTGHDGPREWWPKDLDIILPVDRLANTLPYPVGFKTILGRDIEWSDIDEKELENKMPDYYFAMPEFIKIRNSYLLPAIKSLSEKYRPDLLMLYRYEIDHLSHMQWHEKSKETIIRGYKYMEDFVFQLKTALNPEHLMILSDHGMRQLNSSIPGSKVINDTVVLPASDNKYVIISCDHWGPGFYLLTGVQNKNVEYDVKDVYKLILNIFIK